MNKLPELDDENLKIHLKNRKATILGHLLKVQKVDESIIEIYDQGDESVEERKLSEITSQIEYNDSVRDELTLIERQVDVSPPTNNNPLLQPSMAVKIPKLECKICDGTSKDKLEFKNFLTQFSNCIDACSTLPNANKLTYLHSYLSGYALKIISHLSVTDGNYDVAFSLLNEEFLDIPNIVDESFKTLLSSSPSFDTAFDGLRTYVNECHAIIHDLKQYNINVMEEDTAGCKELSHIIFSKLPTSVKRELVHKVDDNYPSLNHIFDNYREIIKTLVRMSQPRVSSAKSDNCFHNKGNSHGLTKQSSKLQTPSKAIPTYNSSPSTLENFNTSMTNVESKPSPKGSPNSKKPGKHCKLCAGPHSMSQCDNYKSFSGCQVRCVNLKMCKLCTSLRHNASSCPGKDDKLLFDCLRCKSHSHITALCPNLSSESASSNFCVNVHQSSSHGKRLCCLFLPWHFME